MKKVTPLQRSDFLLFYGPIVATMIPHRFLNKLCPKYVHWNLILQHGIAVVNFPNP